MNVSGNQYIKFPKMKFELNGVNKIKIYHEKCKGKCFKIKINSLFKGYIFKIEEAKGRYYLVIYLNKIKAKTDKNYKWKHKNFNK